MPDPVNRAQAPVQERPQYYQEQRRRVIQILKDLGHVYSSEVSCNPLAKTIQTTPEIPHEEVSDGHWNLTPESLRRMRATEGKKRDPYVKSMHLVEDELEVMKHLFIHYYALERVFLRDDAGDRDYNRLQEDYGPRLEAVKKEAQDMADSGNASKDIVRFVGAAYKRSPNVRLLADVDIAIHTLTMRLLDVELHAIFATKSAPKNGRRQSMEDKYREIYRVFDSWCEDLAKKHKRYRNKAYENTVVSTGESRSTVERSVHFVTAGEPAETQSRRRTVKAKPAKCHKMKEGV